MTTKSRGLEFLNDWVKKNVSPNDTGEARATVLATQCILEAATEGIMVAHMEHDGSTVESVILDAMTKSADAFMRAD